MLGKGNLVVRVGSLRTVLAVFLAGLASFSAVPNAEAHAEEAAPAVMAQSVADRALDRTAGERSIWAEHMRGRDRGSQRGDRRLQEDNPPLISFAVLVLFVVLGIWEVRWLIRLVTRRGSGTRTCPGCYSSMPYGADFCPRCRTISLPNGSVISRR